MLGEMDRGTPLATKGGGDMSDPLALKNVSYSKKEPFYRLGLGENGKKALREGNPRMRASCRFIPMTGMGAWGEGEWEGEYARGAAASSTFLSHNF